MEKPKEISNASKQLLKWRGKVYEKEIECAFCGKKVIKHYPTAKFCSPRCKALYRYYSKVKEKQ